jgi:hypothetical protein
MKIPLMLIMSMLNGYAAYSQNKSGIIKIEFATLSRGGQNKQIVCTADSVWISSKEGRGLQLKIEKKKMNPKDWEQLIRSLKNVSLPAISGLQSPTMKRAYDGAKHSTISIYTQEATWSHSFDDESPHEKLSVLLKLMLKKAK